MTLTQLYANASKAIRLRMKQAPSGKHPAIIRSTLAQLTLSATSAISGAIYRSAEYIWPSEAERRAQIAWHSMGKAQVETQLQHEHQKAANEIIGHLQNGYDIEQYIDERLRVAGRYAAELERARLAQWDIN